MTLPQFGQNIARIDIELADILDLNIVAPAAGDILIYDGVNSWDNQSVTGDITITAGGLTAISPGVIVDADISATAEIAVSKLADGAARQVLQTDAAGTGVEWTDNVDLPGTLDVTLLATFDTAITLNEGTAQAGTDVYLARDNDGDLTLNALVGKTINLAIAGADQYTFSATQFDVGSNEIIDIGVAGFNLTATGIVAVAGEAGNFWSQNALTLAGGSATQILTVETTGAGTVANVDLKTPASSTGIARISFFQGSGNGDANNMRYEMGYDGAPAYFYMKSQDTDGSSTSADVWRIPDGQLTIDANTTWDDNAFDNYDDAMVLSPYRNGVINLARRHSDLIEMGVLRVYEDGWIGYNDQRMAALLAGGIYQNRARIDAFADTIAIWQESHDDRLIRVEQDVSRLRAQVVALGGTPEA